MLARNLTEALTFDDVLLLEVPEQPSRMVHESVASAVIERFFMRAKRTGACTESINVPPSTDQLGLY